MKFRNIIGVVIATALFTSCNKFLDVEPKGIVIPKTFQEYDLILNSPVNTNSYPDALVYASDDVFAELSLSAPDPNANAYFWNRIIDVNNDDSPAIWGGFYRQIYNTNIIINNVESSTGASDRQKKQLLGEALADRAFAHFNVLTVFTKIYNPQTAGDLPGIPWVTYTDVTNKTPGRSTLQATLDLIINDLKTAENYLEANRINKTRINKSVAQAMLSRVYLYMGNFAEANKYATLALQEPHEILNYNDYYVPQQEESPEILLLRTSNDSPLIYYLGYSKDLLSIFQPDDLRMELLAYPTGPDSYMRFDGWGMYGIRFAELMFTQAEFLVRQNDLDGALSIINEIRELRIADYAYEPLESSDKAEVLNWVLEERRRELAFGSARWVDMKRLAAEGLGSISTRYTADGEALISIDPSKYSYTYEIPSRVLMFNPGMPTNF